MVGCQGIGVWHGPPGHPVDHVVAETGPVVGWIIGLNDCWRVGC